MIQSYRADIQSAPSAATLRLVAGTEPFSAIVHWPTRTVAIMHVTGEIDMLTEPPLQNSIKTLIATNPERLIIDLSRVSFLGATGLSVLIMAKEVAAQQGTVLQLTIPNGWVVTDLLRTTGLDRLFDILPPPRARDSAEPALCAECLNMPCPSKPQYLDEQHPNGAAHSVETKHDEYAYLIPLQCYYAALSPGHPEQRGLRDQLIKGYLPVAMNIARRFSGRGEPLEDLTQIATVGLINAVDRFDPIRGSHFLSFAVPTITGEIRRYFRDHSWSTRVPRQLKDLHVTIRRTEAQLFQQLGRAPRVSEIADHLHLSTSRIIDGLLAGEAYGSSSLDEALGCEGGAVTRGEVIGTTDDELALVEDRETLRPVLAKLTPRQRTILVLRFSHHWTQDRIAEHFGISQMQISRVLSQTLQFIRQRTTITG